MNLLRKYHAFFPEIENLFPYQERVLTCLSKGNTLSIIPTGGGKSLIFQLYALSLKGITIVISPLVALMNEQVEELSSRRIKAVALNTTLNFEEQRRLLKNLHSFKILYVSPERLQNSFFKAALIASGVNVSMLVIDEAHCISQWGSEFRPEYAQIPDFIKFLSNYNHLPIVFALTATLSRRMREDVMKQFYISENGVYIHDNLIRPNLKLAFSKVHSEKDKPAIFIQFLENYFPAKTIAYLYSRKKSEHFADVFQHLSTAFYHSNVEKRNKDKIQKDFRAGKYKILFATTAFGMGINILDIDAIVQLQPPHSIEEYYQQVGRGWRDKVISKNCHCLAIWSEKNFLVNEQRLRKKYLTKEKFNTMYQSFLGNTNIKAVGQILYISTDKLINASLNLRLLRYKLQEKCVITPITEINGSPTQIIFKEPTQLWTDVLKKAEIFDTFSYVARKLSIPIQSIFEHIFEQELIGNISKFPASNRDFFFQVNFTTIPPSIITSIIEEINQLIEYNIKRLHTLKSLFESSDPVSFLRNTLE